MRVKFSTVYDRTQGKDIFVEGIIETPTEKIVSKTYIEHQQKAFAFMQGANAGEFEYKQFKMVKGNLGQERIVYGEL